MRLTLLFCLLSLSTLNPVHAFSFTDDTDEDVVAAPSARGHSFTPTVSNELSAALYLEIISFRTANTDDAKDKVFSEIINGFTKLSNLPDQALATYNAERLQEIGCPESFVTYVRDSYDDQSHPAWLVYYKAKAKEELRAAEARRKAENSSCCALM